MEIGGNISRTNNSSSMELFRRQRGMALNRKKRSLNTFAARVLKSFLIPNLDSTQNDLSNEVMFEEIERKLRIN